MAKATKAKVRIDRPGIVNNEGKRLPVGHTMEVKLRDDGSLPPMFVNKVTVLGDDADKVAVTAGDGAKTATGADAVNPTGDKQTAITGSTEPTTDGEEKTPGPKSGAAAATAEEEAKKKAADEAAKKAAEAAKK